MSLGFIYHDDYLLHDTGLRHVESPDRLRAIIRYLRERPVWERLRHLTPEPVSFETMTRVHPENHVSKIKSRCLAGEQVLDGGDTYVCERSYDVALLSAGGVVRAVDAVLDGMGERMDSVFCAVRPPGHHACTSRAMGFCLFNNIAIGARHALTRYGLERIAIVDWDVHHGNGTQEVFYSDPSVLYISLHQYPLYPGTGLMHEQGEGAGLGYTLNIPMVPGSGDDDYLAAFDELVIPSLESFRPRLLMISAGFDAHRDDPLANINLSEHSFGKLTKRLMPVAEKHAEGRIVSVLEGGYDLEALPRSVEEHLLALGGTSDV